MWPSLEHALNKEVRGRVMEAFIFQHFSTLFAMYVYAYVCVCTCMCVCGYMCVHVCEYLHNKGYMWQSKDSLWELTSTLWDLEIRCRPRSLVCSSKGDQ